METFTLEELVKKLRKIKSLGFVKTVYANDGGVGATLEKLLGIKENNLKLADWGEVEIKAKREKSKSMLTLTSKQTLPSGSMRLLYDKYGIVRSDGIKKLYCTIKGSAKETHGFILSLKGEKLIIDNPKKVEAYWLIDDLFDHLVNKNKKTLLAFAKTEGKRNTIDEKFHYVEVFLLSGLRMKKFLSAIKDGKLKIDTRIGADKTGKKIGAYHDHGAGMRIHKKDFLELFDEYKVLIEY